MPYRVSVAYRQPADPAAFDHYYRTTHVPIAAADIGNFADAGAVLLFSPEEISGP